MHQQHSFAIDFWALGVTLYEFICLKFPFNFIRTGFLFPENQEEAEVKSVNTSSLYKKIIKLECLKDLNNISTECQLFIQR